MGRVAWLSASVLLVLSQVNAQGAPASSPSSAEDIVMKDLIVLCPINATMEVQSLSIQSMEPTDTTTQTNTEYASYLYTSVNALGGLTTCTSTESPIAAGSTTALPGDSGSYVIYQNNNTLLVSAGGHNESIDVPSGATVTACTAGQTYAINVYSGSNIESQVIFSISTGCWAACAGNTTLSSISAVTGADSSGDTAYASQAGIPLPSNYTPVAAVAEDPLNTNPCLGQDAGYYNGMTSTFFADVYPADSTSKDDFPLDFSGAGNFTRCDCPNQKAINSSWPGTPSLPVTSTFNFTNNFGVVMTGEFLVERPQDGVTGETAALFPTASDYHLVCLQHDDSASMVIDGTNYYSSDSATFEIAGYKQYCVPITMAPGWHNLTLTYGNTPLDLYSVFRFFVINADAVSVVTNNGTQSYEITWDGEGTCCTGSSTDSCVSPLDCCKFRGTTPCSGAAAPSPAIALTPVATQAVTSPGAPVSPTTIPVVTSPSPTVATPVATSPPTVASPAATPAPTVASPVATPTPTVATPVTSPALTVAASPSPTVASPGATPAPTAATPIATPAPTTTSTVAATPAPTTASTPAPTVATPVATPAPTSASTTAATPSPTASPTPSPTQASPVTVASPSASPSPAASPVSSPVTTPAATPKATEAIADVTASPGTPELTLPPTPTRSPSTRSPAAETRSPTTAASPSPVAATPVATPAPTAATPIATPAPTVATPVASPVATSAPTASPVTTPAPTAATVVSSPPPPAVVSSPPPPPVASPVTVATPAPTVVSSPPPPAVVSSPPPPPVASPVTVASPSPTPGATPARTLPAPGQPLLPGASSPSPSPPAYASPVAAAPGPSGTSPVTTGSSITPSPTTVASPSPVTVASPSPVTVPSSPPVTTVTPTSPAATPRAASPVTTTPVASPAATSPSPASASPITVASPVTASSPVTTPSPVTSPVASPVTTGSPSPSPANTDQSVGSSPGVPALTLPPTPTAEPTTVATPAPTTAASPAPTTAGSIASPASSPVSVPSPVATSPASPVTVSSPTTAASPVTHSSPAATPGPTNILNGYVGRPTANPSPVTSPTTVSSPVPTPSPTTAASGLPSSNDTFSISQTTGTSPSAAAPGTSATEVPVSTATAVTGGGVPSPAVADLPDGVTQQTCQQFQSACVSSESTAAPFEFTVTLTCNASSSSQVSYNSSLVYTEGASTGWAAVVPATGTLSLDQAASFTIEITPAKADTGYSTVYLALMQTYASDAAAQTLMGTVQISYFNFGTTSVNFTSIVPSGDGTANVSATVGVDFTAPSGFSVPMSGAITTDASNVSTACAAAAPSSIVGSTSMYTCEASVPIKDAYECLQTSFAFDANFSAALPASPQCGAFSATGNTSYCQQPVCQIYSVDMAFCGQEGLVTDQSQALLVMVCTQEVNVCLDCFTVTGPSNATVQYFNYAQNSTSSYQLLVQWDEAYRGNVTVDLQTNRDESYCNLDLTDPVCGYTTVAPVDALSFMVQDNVQVKAVAYKILYDCDGGQCSYTS
ncbi:MAG: hypothetical protein FRX49_12911 [Trebouxia sp. A1-2]|nr:MAG: hypothetical protein FRX49_12911 [Trebouxia sp. A1-2]